LSPAGAAYAVVGHVEWISFVRVPHLPRAGQIVQAEEAWDEVGGGGAVAAAQIARLAGACHFFTALGEDEFGQRSLQRLTDLGIQVHVAWRSPPQRRGITFLEPAGERTITVIGPRLTPRADDPLPWHLLDSCSGCYFTGGSAAQARRARRLVATTRVRELLEGIVPDAWVGSSRDPREQVDPLRLVGPAGLCVLTRGEQGGEYWTPDQQQHSYAATPLPGPVADAYGCGDSFAGALTYGLGQGLPAGQAVHLAARCGAACLCGQGPYAGQLRS
jgi:ribokinase